LIFKIPKKLKLITKRQPANKPQKMEYQKMQFRNYIRNTLFFTGFCFLLGFFFGKTFTSPDFLHQYESLSVCGDYLYKNASYNEMDEIAASYPWMFGYVTAVCGFFFKIIYKF